MTKKQATKKAIFMKMNLSSFDYDFWLIHFVARLCPPENALMFSWGMEKEYRVEVG